MLRCLSSRIISQFYFSAIKYIRDREPWEGARELINFLSRARFQLVWKCVLVRSNWLMKAFKKHLAVRPVRVSHSSRGIPNDRRFLEEISLCLTEEIRFAACRSFFPSTNPEAGIHREEVIKNLSRIWWPFFFIGVLYFPRFATISRSDFDIAALSPPPPFAIISFSMSSHFIRRDRSTVFDSRNVLGIRLQHRQKYIHLKWSRGKWQFDGGVVTHRIGEIDRLPGTSH